jgi:hypothetical protein
VSDIARSKPANSSFAVMLLELDSLEVPQFEIRRDPCRNPADLPICFPLRMEDGMVKSKLRALRGGVISSAVIFASIRGEIAFAVLMFLVGGAFACWDRYEWKHDNAKGDTRR